MKELFDSLNADFDDAEGWIRIVDANWFADNLTLHLSIKFHDDREPELWDVSCSGVVEEFICSEHADDFAVSTDSPLLKPFLEPEVHIMFSQNSIVPDALFGIVCSCCMEVMGRAESITRFINAAPNINGICSSNFGLLGRFPKSLAERILDVLIDKPIKTSALPGGLPKRWDGSKHVDYGQLEAFEIGRSYVVAEQFTAHRA
jgi:hypothetical protein